MIRLSDIKLPLDFDEYALKKACAKQLGVDVNTIRSAGIARRSIDARKKDNITFTVTADIIVNGSEQKILRQCRNSKAAITEPYSYTIPKGARLDKPPIVVGAGPAGLFAAYTLACAGLCPILIERGKSVDERTKDVSEYWQTGKLDTNSSVQFGEGGAGTFSDGKLNTGTKDIRSRFVLETFVKHGAPTDILVNAKPHIGTDKLKNTVKSIREEIISLGGTVLFETTLVDMMIKSGTVCGIKVLGKSGSISEIETNNVILALGHSARDTFHTLFGKGFVMEAKPFSVGARIEHLQSDINKAQYGKFWNSPVLGAADYKLSAHLKNGRGVYTFCMCPGGSVVASASEENTVVTNGMSEYARDGINANSALLVGVSPEDYESGHPLAGIEFQRKIERLAFLSGGGNSFAPCIRVSDFLKGTKSTAFGSVKPTYRPGVTFASPEEYLPQYICESMREGILLFDKKLKGFADGDALLTGVETRSSSPVRILRGSDFNAVNIKGAYPCGEGAGYAGGIVSAAVDGVRCAEAVISISNSD